MTDDHSGALLEIMNDRLAAILEGQAALASVPGAIQEIKEQLTEVKSDIKVIKAAVTDQSTELKDHESRITSLEACSVDLSPVHFSRPWLSRMATPIATRAVRTVVACTPKYSPTATSDSPDL
jgi:hypothetical protein